MIMLVDLSKPCYRQVRSKAAGCCYWGCFILLYRKGMLDKNCRKTNFPHEN
ncbi:hypothetical protein AAZX31_11G249200 [Glycine max]